MNISIEKQNKKEDEMDEKELISSYDEEEENLDLKRIVFLEARIKKLKKELQELEKELDVVGSRYRDNQLFFARYGE
jgi:molecular chaperone GrpE (heat shock protein)